MTVVTQIRTLLVNRIDAETDIGVQQNRFAGNAIPADDLPAAVILHTGTERETHTTTSELNTSTFLLEVYVKQGVSDNLQAAIDGWVQDIMEAIDEQTPMTATDLTADNVEASYYHHVSAIEYNWDHETDSGIGHAALTINVVYTTPRNI